jgi:hypothetical protein
MRLHDNTFLALYLHSTFQPRLLMLGFIDIFDWRKADVV